LLWFWPPTRRTADAEPTRAIDDPDLWMMARAASATPQPASNGSPLAIPAVLRNGAVVDYASVHLAPPVRTPSAKLSGETFLDAGARAP
jgi:hypothetical protein